MEEKLILNKLEGKDGVVKVQSENIEETLLFYEQAVKLNGTIQAPGNFIQKREGEHQPLKAHVLFSYRDLYIKLRTEESAGLSVAQDISQPYYEITGKLTPNPEIGALTIGTGKIWEVKNLSNHLRMNKFFFADGERNLRLVEELQKFRMSAQVEIESFNDQKGSAKELYEIKAAKEYNLSFDVLMPVYIGQPAKKFKVEIAYSVREKQVDFWMESPELNEILKADRAAIIDAELLRFPKEFVFIEQ